MKRALIALLLSGCAHSHGRANAPGNVDVHRPPEQIDRRNVEPPEDPGENMVTLAVGPFGGAGVAFGGDEEARFAYSVGPELGLGFGSRTRSHNEDDFIVFPERSIGANVGWTALSGEGEGVGPIYGELFYQELITWLAGGWVWDPDDHTHGPQITLSTLFLYLRATHRFDLATEIQGGISVKLPYSWIWSR